MFFVYWRSFCAFFAGAGFIQVPWLFYGVMRPRTNEKRASVEKVTEKVYLLLPELG